MYEYNLANFTGTTPTTYGYWTKTASASNSTDAWVVDSNGDLDESYVHVGANDGVRPVISLSKSLISQQ